MRGSKARKQRQLEPETYKLDLGCGTRKQEGFLGVDVRDFPGVDLVLDLAKEPWPWPAGAVTEAYSAHVLEHLTALQRCHFFNELYRVLAPGAKATIVTPYWCSNRAYGDPTHVWPPVSEMTYYYLDAEWRKVQAPHTCELLTCDFRGTTVGYNGHPSLNGRNEQYVTFALQNYKEAALDLVATLTKQ